MGKLIDIKDHCGFKIKYNPDRRMFSLHSEEGEMGESTSQQELEQQAEKLAVANWDRWHIIHDNAYVSVTSYNPMGGRGWIVNDETGQKREINLGWFVSYPVTPENKRTLEQIKGLQQERVRLAQEIEALEKSFTGKLEKFHFDDHAKHSKAPVKPKAR